MFASRFMRAALGSFAVSAIPLAALAAPNAQSRTIVTNPHSLYQLNAVQATTARTAAQSDSRIVSLLGTGPALVQMSGVQLVKAARADQAARPPARIVSVLLFNPRTSRAANARVDLGTNRVIAIEQVTLDELPIFREEAEQAVTLARADRNVRSAVGNAIDNYRLRLPGVETAVPYAIEIMPLYTSSVRDLCFTGRCVELHFRTPQGYLPVRAQVNLAARSVTLVPRTRSHGGMH